MARRTRKSFQVRPSVLDRLEDRRLLAFTIDSIVQGGDFTGSTSSVGPDGITDIKITLASVPSSEVNSVIVEGTRADSSKYIWQYGRNVSTISNYGNPGAFDYAEFIRVTETTDPFWPYRPDSASNSSPEIYVNPPVAGGAFVSFKVLLAYGNSTTADEQTASLGTNTLHNRIAFSRTSETAPTYLANAAEFQTNQFLGTETSIKKDGDIQIKLTSLPSGFDFSHIQDMYLDNGTGSPHGNIEATQIHYGGAVWSDEYGKGEYRLGFLQADSGQPHIADIYAKPIRNEANSTMTLVVKLRKSGVDSYFYTQFAGKTVDETLSGRTSVAWANGTGSTYYVRPKSGNASRVEIKVDSGSWVDGGSTFNLYDLLRSGGTSYIPTGAKVVFTSGTYDIPQTTSTNGLKLDRAMSLEAESGATLRFLANSAASGGVVNAYPQSLLIQSSHVQVKGFTINFPNQVYYSENRPAVSILPSAWGGFMDQLVNVRLIDNDITGPKPSAADATSQGKTTQGRQGREAKTFLSTNFASGVISGNTIRAGSLELQQGPWTVTDNLLHGPVSTETQITGVGAEFNTKYLPSYTPQLIFLNSPRDVVVSHNTASVLAPTGTNYLKSTVYRFLFMKNDNGAGHNVEISDNTIGDGVGSRLGDSIGSWYQPSGPQNYADDANLPEIILSENYHLNYEGITLPISSDRRIVQLPSPETSVRGRQIAAGDVIAILEGPFAGQYRTIAQVLQQAKDKSTVLLLQEPMPGTQSAPVVSVGRGTTNLKLTDNDIDLTQTTSYGFVLNGNEYGVLIKGNRIKGDYLTTANGSQVNRYQIGMRLEAHASEKSSEETLARYITPNPLPAYRYWTKVPMFGLQVVDNVFDGPLKGIEAGTIKPDDAATVTFGRLYFDGEISNNIFTAYPNQDTTGNSTRAMDSKTVITIGNYSSHWQSGPSTYVYGSANLSGQSVVVNSTNPGTSRYLPNAVSGYDIPFFADPYAIRLTMQNNWLDTGGGASYKQQEITSAVINGSAKVLASWGAKSDLPTKPSTPIYDYVADELSSKASFSGSAGWSNWTNNSGYNRSHSTAGTNNSLSTITATTTWKFVDLEPGQYEVWASWVASDPYRSLNAPYTVYDGTKALGTVRVNQTLSPDYHDSNMVPSLGDIGWSRIGGTFQIDGNTLIVTLTNNTNESGRTVVADAIRIRRKTTMIADDDGAGYSETSGWTNYAGVKDVGHERDHSAASTVGSSSSATATATWTFGNITPGEYEVWVTWVSANNRANDAPFTIKDGSTSRGTLRVDQSKAPSAGDSGMYEKFDGTYWRKLSTTFRVDGNQLVVELANNAESGKYVVADAVRIKRKASTVMNDREENFLASPSSNWTLYSGSSITGFRNGHYVAPTSGSPSSTTATATWTFGSLDPGQYEVWVTWVGGDSNRSTKAPYTVKDDSTVRHTQAINQFENPGSVSGNEGFENVSWVKLSSVVDIYSGSLIVQLANNTDEPDKRVIADGVRIKKVASLLLDDADLGFATTKTGSDSWAYYGSPWTTGHLKDHSALTKTSSGTSSVGTATWTFDNLVAGATYAIYATWVQDANNRTTAAPYYANATLLSTVDQRYSPGSTGTVVWLKNGTTDSEFRLLNTYYHTSGSLVVKLDTNTSALGKAFVADAIHIRRVSPLQSSSSDTETTQQRVDLLDSVPTSIINEAVARWSSTGLSAAQIDLLRSASVTVADLAPGYLGVSDGKDVVIDRDGDGRGWFIDSTPGDDSEFLGSGLVNQSAFDLLTLMMHEFGHVLGFSDKEGESDDLMSESITPGVRKIPAGRIEPASPTKSISIPTETSSSVRNARVQRMLDRIEFREQRIGQIKMRIASRPVQTGQSLASIGRFSNPRTRFRPVN